MITSFCATFPAAPKQDDIETRRSTASSHVPFGNRSLNHGPAQGIARMVAAFRYRDGAYLVLECPINGW